MRLKYKHPVIWVLLLLAQMVMACNDNAKDTAISLVSESVVKIGYGGGEELVKFICYDKWAISSDVAWIKFVSPTEGNGNAIVKINIDKNTSTEKRIGKLTIVCGGNVEVIEVEQAIQTIGFVHKHPSILYTKEELLNIKSIIEAGSSASITATYNNLMNRCNKALTYATTPYTGQDPAKFIDASYAPGSNSRDLAMAYWFTKDEKYAQKSIEIMEVWAKACKDISYVADAGSAMYLARGMYPMVCAYDMLVSENIMDEETKKNIIDWFQILYREGILSIEKWENNDYFNKQYFQNHLVAHTMGILMLGLVTDNDELIQFAIDSPSNPRDIYELLTGCIFMDGDIPCSREKAGAPAPVKGEIYDRYRHDTAPLKGLQYTHLTLTLLSTNARMCYNNGLDIFAYTAPTGENLRYPFEYYSDFYRLMDSCIKSGYYCGETERLAKAGDNPGMYEIGFRYYPDSESIKQMINSGTFNRESSYMDLFGYTRFLSAGIDE
ncbi:alginate lyase family protein [Bacteroides sp. GM023]|uniref:alginate lyase family protein n=1 Tax=Bacteroides sp. GM023 TaxID=2723058 RepID=UPI00168A7B65|nr:alginate lyase family protein [Bacteroides sp. GM023]MBD3588569.1 hypothetical protein [Bacteroides sp. GM023]